MKKPALNHAQLRSMLDYDAETGTFTWKQRDDVRAQWNGRYAGKVAGYARTATGGGLYWSIRIFDWPFHAGPLAWFYMTGDWPAAIVDHADCNGLNNRWSNLRLATKAQNAANVGASKANTSGFKGVSAKAGRWRATIYIGGKQKALGTFDTAAEAHVAYAKAAAAVHGPFARAA